MKEFWTLSRILAFLEVTPGYHDKQGRLRLPAEEGTHFSRGAERHAYRFGNYVVKGFGFGERHIIPRKEFKRVGVLPPRRWLVGEWEVQPYYKPMSERAYRKLPKEWRRLIATTPYDLWYFNLGFNKQGRIVAFDW